MRVWLEQFNDEHYIAFFCKNMVEVMLERIFAELMHAFVELCSDSLTGSCIHDEGI